MSYSPWHNARDKGVGRETAESRAQRAARGGRQLAVRRLSSAYKRTKDSCQTRKDATESGIFTVLNAGMIMSTARDAADTARPQSAGLLTFRVLSVRVSGSASSVEQKNGNGNVKGNKTNNNGVEVNRNEDQNGGVDAKGQAKKKPNAPGGGPLLQQA